MVPTPSRRKKSATEPDFEHPPLWIHEVVAGILAPKREVKRRAVLELLNRLPVRPPSSSLRKAIRRSRS